MKRLVYPIVATVIALFLISCSESGSTSEKVSQNTTEPANQTTQVKQKVDANPVAENTRKQHSLIPLAEAQNAPNWKLSDLDGNMKQLSDYKGKVVILDFWDTWCPPCKKEIPGFIELQDQYGDNGLVIIGAAFGRDGKDAVAEFTKEWKINYPIVLADRETSNMYGGIRSIPTTFVIDQEGRVRAVHVGYVFKGIFEEQVKELLDLS
ncbi:TlpA family protein disulfide reductase [bacterium]|nr:TlpA family protein disulfide reductase [bacterium]